MSETTYTVIYFAGIYGRGGPVCDALKVGKIPFTFQGVAFPDWPALKPTMPTRQLPTMVVNQNGVETKCGQSGAVLRFAGKLAGLYPEDPVDAMKVDMIVDTCEDMMGLPWSNPGIKSDDEAVKTAAVAETIAKIEDKLALIESMIPAGVSHAAQHCVGHRLTTADLKIRSVADALRTQGWGFAPFLPHGMLDKFPKIAAVDSVAAGIVAAAE
eukprot:Amastigsp_a678595_444.p2 type:complete len:213 gc:universal Amastigsp_a678595_444:657-19(-)